MMTLCTAFLALHAIEAIRTRLATILAGPAGCTDTVARIRVTGWVVQASANLITIFTIVTARTVRLAINALGSVRLRTQKGIKKERHECKTKKHKLS